MARSARGCWRNEAVERRASSPFQPRDRHQHRRGAQHLRVSRRARSRRQSLCDHDERDLLTAPAHKTAGGSYTLGSYPAIARHSAVGDLAPLRALLHRLITLGLNGSDPFTNTAGAHRSWSLLPLAMRSSDVLVNQVHRFSVDEIALCYREAYAASADKVQKPRIVDKEGCCFCRPRAARILRVVKPARRPELAPTQVHARYMHCLIAYGRQFADTRSKVLTGGDLSAPTLPVMSPGASGPRQSPANG